MANPQNLSRKKKYLFQNNQHTGGNKTYTKETPTKSLHARKVISNPSSSCAGKNEADSYFILMNFSILKSFIQKVSICTITNSACSDLIKQCQFSTVRMGLSCNLVLVCNDCLHKISFYT